MVPQLLEQTDCSDLVYNFCFDNERGGLAVTLCASFLSERAHKSLGGLFRQLKIRQLFDKRVPLSMFPLSLQAWI